jgi:hypothetical protein
MEGIYLGYLLDFAENVELFYFYVFFLCGILSPFQRLLNLVCNPNDQCFQNRRHVRLD